MKKLIKKFLAITSAKGGDTETARQILDKAKKGKELKKVKVKDKNKEPLIEKHDRAMEAITFAEAGEHNYAQSLLKREKTEKASEREKILVVGNEAGFSETLSNYAIEMAERMNYEIVALNVIPMGKRLASFLHDRIKEELQTRTEDAAEAFKTKALEKNIPFTHTVKFGEIDRMIKALNGEFKRVSFILSEPEHVPDGDSTREIIPVFCYTDV